MNRLIENIQKEIRVELPGMEAWARMMPAGRLFPLKSEGFRKASVLILLYPKGKDLFFVLIKRTVDEGPHSGQISLPGGMCEKNDLNGQYTALRETAEETGIPLNDVNIIGSLTKLTIPVSRTIVTPFIGYLTYTPEFNPDPVEVDYLIEVDLNMLLKPEIVSNEPMDLSGEIIDVPYYPIHGEKVWGATAMILSEFIDLAGKVVQGPDAQY